mmetsp:Transcript_18924/g.44353  ORF Transcript_18924/g.44353 Transcript_18924/m.44353 type:complete len:233 (+) Transcript_18924:1764-2462(+)
MLGRNLLALGEHVAPNAGLKRAVASARLVPLALVRVVHTVRFDMETDDEHTVRVQILLGYLDRVVQNLEAQMIVQIIEIVALRSLFHHTKGVSKGVHGERISAGVIGVHEVAHLREGKIIRAHVDVIVEDGEILELFHVLSIVHLAAQNRALAVLHDIGMVCRRHRLLSEQRFAKILSVLDFLRRRTKRKLIVVKLELALAARESLDLDVQALTALVNARRNTRQIEGCGGV